MVEENTTTSIAGKSVLLVVNQDEERQAFTDVLETLHLHVFTAVTGGTALEVLEDHPVDLLVMDIQPPDMHGWQLLAKVKEIDTLRELPIIVLADRPNLSPNVANVIYLTRPVSIARLRQNIMHVLGSTRL